MILAPGEPTMSVKGTPFVEFRKIDVQAAYGFYSLEFYMIDGVDNQIMIGIARRLHDPVKVEDFVSTASQDQKTWAPGEQEYVNCLVTKDQLSRAEEWILSRLIRKRGLEEFRTAAGTSIPPFTSISHSTEAIAVAFTDVPVGIDHEIIKTREASWARRMDPSGDSEGIREFLAKWQEVSRQEAETIIWAAKEAALKAWGIATVGSIPEVRVATNNSRIDASLLMGTGEMRECLILVSMEKEGVIAVALNSQKSTTTP